MKPSLVFQDIQVTGVQIAHAALEYRCLRYQAGSTHIWQAGGDWYGSTNCYGLLLLTARDVGLLPEDFDVNLTPATFGQRQPKTLWEIVHNNFIEIPRESLDLGDLMLMHYYGPNEEPHHVSLCVPSPDWYAGYSQSWLLHAVDSGSVEWNPIDPLVETHVKSVWRLKSLQGGAIDG